MKKETVLSLVFITPFILICSYVVCNRLPKVTQHSTEDLRKSEQKINSVLKADTIIQDKIIDSLKAELQLRDQKISELSKRTQDLKILSRQVTGSIRNTQTPEDLSRSCDTLAILNELLILNDSVKDLEYIGKISNLQVIVSEKDSTIHSLRVALLNQAELLDSSITQQEGLIKDLRRAERKLKIKSILTKGAALVAVAAMSVIGYEVIKRKLSSSP